MIFFVLRLRYIKLDMFIEVFGQVEARGGMKCIGERLEVGAILMVLFWALVNRLTIF